MKGTIIKKEDSGESYQDSKMYFCEMNTGDEILMGVTYRDDWNVGDEVEFESRPHKRHGQTFSKPKTGEWGGNRSNSAVDKYEAKKAGVTDDRQNSIIRQSSLKVATDIVLASGKDLKGTEILGAIKELTKENNCCFITSGVGFPRKVLSKCFVSISCIIFLAEYSIR